MADTLTVDIIDHSVPIGNDVNIAIINQPNPVTGYSVTGKELMYLIQLPKYYITDSATGTPVNGKNIFDYFPELNPGGGGTVKNVDTEISTTSENPVQNKAIGLRFEEIQAEIDAIDVSKLSVTEYEKDTRYPRGRIVYVTPGQLYQATQEFVSNNDPGKTLSEAMAADISAGNLSAVTDAEIGDLGQRMDAAEEDIIQLKLDVIAAKEVVFCEDYAHFPVAGDSDKIYTDKETNKTYTWSSDLNDYVLMDTNNIIAGSVLQSTI